MIWAPFLILFMVFGWAMVRPHDIKNRHRSFPQWVIWRLSRFVHWLHAVQVGIDLGYLHYRHTLVRPLYELQNEKELGLLIGKAPAAEVSLAQDWVPATE